MGMSRFYHCSEIAEHRETDFNCFDRQAGVRLTEANRKTDWNRRGRGERTERKRPSKYADRTCLYLARHQESVLVSHCFCKLQLPVGLKEMDTYGYLRLNDKIKTIKWSQFNF